MASTIGDLIDKIKEYIELKAEQLKLKALPHVSRFIAGIIALSSALLFGFLTLFFLSFAVANILNDLLGSSFYGYLIISGLFLIIILVILLLVKKGIVQGWIEEVILKTSKDEHEED